MAARLPADPAEFAPASDASDAVILHCWQAVQIIVDLATAACPDLKLGTPGTYADAFRRLAEAGHLDGGLAARLERAVGFWNAVAHASERLDMTRIHRSAQTGPEDLRAFVTVLNRLV